MSVHHRRVLLREALEHADFEIGQVHDVGMGTFVYAERTSSDVEPSVNAYHTLEEATEAQGRDRIIRAARFIKTNAGFDDPHPFGGQTQWEGIGNYAYNERARVASEPEAVLNEWIDQHGEGVNAVNALTSERANRDLKTLADTAQASRPQDTDLASPDEVMAHRRTRGMRM